MTTYFRAFGKLKPPLKLLRSNCTYAFFIVIIYSQLGIFKENSYGSREGKLLASSIRGLVMFENNQKFQFCPPRLSKHPTSHRVVIGLHYVLLNFHSATLSYQTRLESSNKMDSNRFHMRTVRRIR